MLRWLRRYWDKPAEPALGPIQEKEFAGLLAELANGYEAHKPVFRALQIMTNQAERAALRVPVLATPADLELWKAEQYALLKVAAVLRRALRLPIEGQKLIVKQAQAKQAKEEQEEEVDLD